MRVPARLDPVDGSVGSGASRGLLGDTLQYTAGLARRSSVDGDLHVLNLRPRLFDGESLGLFAQPHVGEEQDCDPRLDLLMLALDLRLLLCIATLARRMLERRLLAN